MTVPAARGHGGAISASHRKLTSVANVKLVAMGQKETNSAPIFRAYRGADVNLLGRASVVPPRPASRLAHPREALDRAPQPLRRIAQ